MDKLKIGDTFVIEPNTEYVVLNIIGNNVYFLEEGKPCVCLLSETIKIN